MNYGTVENTLTLRPITLSNIQYTQGELIGSGTFGTVFKAKGSDGSDAVMKLQKIRQDNTEAQIRQEYKIHKDLSAVDSKGYVIKMIGMRGYSKEITMIIEHADTTLHSIVSKLSPAETKKYFTSLTLGVEFLHSKSIGHCDIALKNLLILNGELKIADFGKAKKLMNQDQKLMSQNCRGNPQYWAPELFETGKLVKVSPLDTWSCGIVLLQMANKSERCWTRATMQDPEYNSWASGKSSRYDFWARTDKTVMALVKKILMPVPTERATIQQIKQDPFLEVKSRVATKRSGAPIKNAAKKKKN